jgi:DNA-binding transcriptional ArsR family regulator
MSKVFAALADPTRRRIMERLARRGESQVTALVKPFHMSLPALSRHLRVLEHARLVQRRRQGRLHLIRARAAEVREPQKWISHYISGWETSFDKLEQLLRLQQRKDSKQWNQK